MKRKLVALGIAGLAVIAVSEIPRFDEDGLQVLSDAFAGVVFLGCGLWAWARRPDSRLGPWMVAFAYLWPVGSLGGDEDSALAQGIGLLFTASFVPPFVALLLVYPGTSLATRTDRLLAWGGVAYALVAGARYLVWDPHHPSAECPECPNNAVLIFADRGLFDATLPVVLVGAVMLAGGVGAVMVGRWRAASKTGRRILAPVYVPMMVAVVATAITVMNYTKVLEPVVDASLIVRNLILALIPLGFLAGLMRTRVTRSNVGRLVVELSAIASPGALRDALARALGDPTLVLAFRAGDRYVDGDGRPVELPEGAAVTEIEGAVLAHDPLLLEDEGLVETVAAAARMALENARLQAQVRAQLEEVRRARRRIVEASDGERRRIERDLHDGAQQRLVSLAMSLRMLQDRIHEDDPVADSLIEQAAAEAQGAIDELRELARGIHPAILTNAGLGPALRALAERASLPVRIAAAPERRLPSPIEVAAYFVCSECVANASKHAHASVVEVSVRSDGDRVLVEICDDGVGGATLAGSGLAGLRDRVEALGGTLEVHSPPGRGTRVAAAIPCGEVVATTV